MPQKLYRSFQVLVLLGLAVFFASKIANGQIVYYINIRFVPLTIFGAIMLAVFAQNLSRKPKVLEESDHHHTYPAANLWFMLLPLAIGLLIPARPLDSAAIDTKGFNAADPLIGVEVETNTFETESQNRNILDWLKIFYVEADLTPYIGQEASVIGFVYKDENLPEDQFYISRFIVSCCAADGFAVAMAVEWDGALSLEEDTWAVVKGPVHTIELDGETLPLIKATSVESVPVPAQPYLFP